MLTFSSPAARRLWEAGERFAGEARPERRPAVVARPMPVPAPLPAPVAVAAPPPSEPAEAVADTAPPKPTIEAIRAAVCRHFIVSKADLLSDRRTRSIVRPRHVAMYLAKTLTARSLPEIGRRLGGRDHTTILHGARKIEALIEAGDPIAADVEKLLAELRGG